MFSHRSNRSKQQTSSQTRRKNKYILPLSRPKMLLQSSEFKNLTNDMDHTFTTILSRNSFSLKTLNTNRPSKQIKPSSKEGEIGSTFFKVNTYKVIKHKFDIILCLENKQIFVSINANTVQQLTNQVRKYLKMQKINSNIKSLETANKDLALNYFLSLPDMKLQKNICDKLRIRPYYGIDQSEVNIQGFQIIKAIGCGGFSTVFLVRYKGDGKFYAMKAISKPFILKNKKQKLIINQKNVMIRSSHPFLAKLHWSFQSKNYLIFVMEYYPGGELFGTLKKYKRMSQPMTKFYITEILLGLQQLHGMGIAYRDLKPENILLDLEGHACIADFGLVKPGLRTSNIRTFSFCGSPEYMPPQVVAKKGHSLNVDFYSLGALMFELLTGLPPFYNRNPEQIYKETLNGTLVVPNFLSENAHSLLQGLLCKQQQNRLGAKKGVEQILNHPWFGNPDRQRFLKKKVIPPLSFLNIKDLCFNEVEMKYKNRQYLKGMEREQLQSDDFAYMIPDFRFSRSEKFTEKRITTEEKQNKFYKTTLFKRKEIKLSSSSQRFKRFDNFF